MCCVYLCKRRPVLCGYCREHYESDIRPYSSLTRQQLWAFIQAVQLILQREFRLSLPAELLQSSTRRRKEQLRTAYRETKRYVDTRLRPVLWRRSSLAERAPLHGDEWVAWEQLCVQVARALFGDVLLHPRLPNNARPDIVPQVRGIRVHKPGASSVRVLYAPLVVEVKRSALHGAVLPKYGRYAGRVEVWFYRWRPHWPVHREANVTYQSPIELAQRLERAGHRRFASLLRSLPLLWRDYELLPHYITGISKAARKGRRAR